MEPTIDVMLAALMEAKAEHGGGKLIVIQIGEYGVPLPLETSGFAKVVTKGKGQYESDGIELSESDPDVFVLRCAAMSPTKWLSRRLETSNEPA